MTDTINDPNAIETDANTLSFGLSCVGGVPSADNMNESEEDFILSNAEVYALLSKDATVRSEDQLSEVFKAVHKYTRRFNGCIGRIQDFTEAQKESLTQLLEELRDSLLAKAFVSQTTGEELRLHKYEASKLMDLMSGGSEPDEAKCLIPSLKERFTDGQVQEYLDLVQKSLVKIQNFFTVEPPIPPRLTPKAISSKPPTSNVAPPNPSHPTRVHFPNISNSSAFVALAESEGSVEEACAKLSDDRFLHESKLISRVADINAIIRERKYDEDPGRGLSDDERFVGAGEGSALELESSLDTLSVLSSGLSRSPSPSSSTLPVFSPPTQIRVGTAEGGVRTQRSQRKYMSQLCRPDTKSNRKSDVDFMVEQFATERVHTPSMSVKVGGIIRANNWGHNARTGAKRGLRNKLLGRGKGGTAKGSLPVIFSPIKASA